ncbi:glycosyltransferase family 2 protein [Desulfovibrio sp. OttesenSCG-928-G11]|nr:glycosyltransferase family 2 protein [Desulfovibrio sp. OttesenSCG-928-G11]
MNDAPLFSVIIPVLNNWNLTRACLHSLKKHGPDRAFEVIVVDNGSSDATAAVLEPLGRSLFGARFKRLRFEENRNFGPACNAGALAAGADLLFFLNNDTLLTPGWAPPLLAAFAEAPDLGAAGPLLLYENNTVQHLGVYCSLDRVGHLYRGFPRDHPAVFKKRRLKALTAAALMTPRRLFLELEGFFEGFVNGFEDVDFCLRLGRQGLAMVCVPDSVVYHLESRTPGRRDGESRNTALLSSRHPGVTAPDLHLHGARDGFKPVISEALDLNLHMTGADEKRLLQEAGQDLEALFALSRANPLWVKGRELLCARYFELGDLDAALAMLVELANILLSVAACESYLAACERFGRNPVAGALPTLALLKAAKQDARRVRVLYRRYRRLGDAGLDRLLDEYLAPLLP